MCLPLTEANVDRFKRNQAALPSEQPQTDHARDADEADHDSAPQRSDGSATSPGGLSSLRLRSLVWLAMLALGLGLIYLVDLHVMQRI